MNTLLSRYAGWTAYLNGIFAILSLVTLMLFFALDAEQAAANPSLATFSWGTLNDIIGCAAMLPMLLLALTIFQMERERAPGLSLIGLLIGAAGMAGVFLLQLLLILKVIPFEQEVGPVVVANGIVGVWLILVNYAGRVQNLVPTRVAWLGIVVGGAFVSAPIMLSVLGGGVDWGNLMSNYLFLTASTLVFLLMYVGFPAWAIWLGRVFTVSAPEARATARSRGALAG